MLHLKTLSVSHQVNMCLLSVLIPSLYPAQKASQEVLILLCELRQTSTYFAEDLEVQSLKFQK